MMRMANIKMTTRVDRAELLAALRRNLAEHAQIYKEACEGYARKAERALAERIGQVREGKVVNLVFTLATPTNYSEVYETAIKMLEWSKDETVELGPDEFRQLVEDKWDWSQGWLVAQSEYSSTATEKLRK